MKSSSGWDWTNKSLDERNPADAFQYSQPFPGARNVVQTFVSVDETLQWNQMVEFLFNGSERISPPLVAKRLLRKEDLPKNLKNL